MLLLEFDVGCIAGEELEADAAIKPPFEVEDEPLTLELFVAGTFSDDVGVSDGDEFPLV